VWLAEEPWEELQAYVGTYLKEEIMAEALVRRIDTFSAFLELCAFRKATSRAKFYLFDLGVTNSLAGRHEIPVGTETFGKAFEHFIALELRAYLSYRRLNLDLGFRPATALFRINYQKLIRLD
jgi:hypothetical protein